MKKLTMFLFLTVILSCSTNESDPLNPEAQALKSKRDYFKNWEDFNSRYFELAKSSTEQISDNQSSISMDDDDSKDLSPALNKILNKNREFQIADEIVWYNKGAFYSIYAKDEIKIQELKSDYLNLPICKNIAISIVETSNPAKNITKTSKTPLGISGAIDAKYQYEFFRQAYIDCGSTINQGSSSKKLKYVHELATELITSNMQRNYYLYLRIKLEYNISGRRWRPANLEKRTINVNITDSSRLVPGTGFVFPYVINNIVTTFNCSYDQQILLRYGADSTLFAPNTRWDAAVTGTIIHSVNGDYFGNEWTNYVNW